MSVDLQAARLMMHHAAWLSDVDAALKIPAARDWILGNVEWNAILRNTISETGLSGSSKTNVIPAEATADLDIRLLPDQDTAAFRAELVKVADRFNAQVKAFKAKEG